MFGGSLCSALTGGRSVPALRRGPRPSVVGSGGPRPFSPPPAPCGRAPPRWAGLRGERLSGGAPRSLSLPLRVPLRFLIPRSLRSLGIFKATHARGFRNQRHGCDHAVMISNLPLRAYALERIPRASICHGLRPKYQTHPPHRNKKGGVHCHTPLNPLASVFHSCGYYRTLKNYKKS